MLSLYMYCPLQICQFTEVGLVTWGWWETGSDKCRKYRDSSDVVRSPRMFVQVAGWIIYDCFQFGQPTALISASAPVVDNKWPGIHKAFNVFYPISVSCMVSACLTPRKHIHLHVKWDSIFPFFSFFFFYTLKHNKEFSCRSFEFIRFIGNFQNIPSCAPSVISIPTVGTFAVDCLIIYVNCAFAKIGLMVYG